jgi:hypothetical protein
MLVAQAIHCMNLALEPLRRVQPEDALVARADDLEQGLEILCYGPAAR